MKDTSHKAMIPDMQITHSVLYITAQVIPFHLSGLCGQYAVMQYEASSCSVSEVHHIANECQETKCTSKTLTVRLEEHGRSRKPAKT